MKKKLTTVQFRGTKEQEEKLLEVIAKHQGTKGAMMPILQEAQEIYGYLPIEVQKIIADKTGTPLEEIFGIVSFYAQFALNPKGDVAMIEKVNEIILKATEEDLFLKWYEDAAAEAKKQGL